MLAREGSAGGRKEETHSKNNNTSVYIRYEHVDLDTNGQ